MGLLLLRALRFAALLATVVFCGCSSSRWNPWTRSEVTDFENRSALSLSDGAPYSGPGGSGFQQQPNEGFKASLSDEGYAGQSYAGQGSQQPQRDDQQNSGSFAQNTSFASPPIAPSSNRFQEANHPGLARPQNGVQQQPLVQQGQLFEPGQVVARVGDQTILAGDLLGDINQYLDPFIAQIPKEVFEEQKEAIEAKRKELMKQMLASHVESKLLYLQFLRQVPQDRLADIENQMFEEFDESFEEIKQKVAAIKEEDTNALTKLSRSEPILVKLSVFSLEEKIDNNHDLDLRLRSFGSSLLKQKRAYAERKIGRSMIARDVEFDPEIMPDEMRDYYREHQDEFATEAKVRWEQLMVRNDKFLNQEAAYQEIANLGNEIFLGGAPLSAVAKKSSQGPNAEQGGYHDWMTPGSLSSKAIDEAIFRLPPNRLSQIIESERGFHIVRVLERVEAGSQPFMEAQTDIKGKIRQTKVSESIAAFLKEIRDTTPVWTIFDEENDRQTAEVPREQTRY